MNSLSCQKISGVTPAPFNQASKVFLRNPIVGGTFHIQITSICSFITHTAYTGSFYLGRVLAPTKEIQADKVAVTYAEARPKNRYDMSKRRHNIVKKCNVFLSGYVSDWVSEFAKRISSRGNSLQSW